MNSPRRDFIRFLKVGAIANKDIQAAMNVAKLVPDGKAWTSFIERLLLWFASLAISFSVLFFIAYNWDEIGKFAKFILVESLLVIATLVYVRLNTHLYYGKIALVMASIILGVLLALYGQTYQTGADPWQLFFYWALLILPWVMIGSSAALWLLWCTLINLSIILYYHSFQGIIGTVFDSGTSLLWLLFIANSFALFSWELLANKFSWLSELWLLVIRSGEWYFNNMVSVICHL